jgi:hypothetical protein
MSKYSWEYKITLLCALCSLVLFVLLGLEWGYGKHYRNQIIYDIFHSKKAGFEMQAVPTYPFSQMPIEHYADFVERPVYFEKRRPIAKIAEPTTTVAEVPKSPTGEFGLILTGIVKTPRGVNALFQNPKAPSVAEKNKRLAKDEVFNGWRLIDIQADKVVIQAESETKELLLLKAKPKNPVLGVGNINPFAPPNVQASPPQNTPPPHPNPSPFPNVNPFNLKH